MALRFNGAGRIQYDFELWVLGAKNALKPLRIAFLYLKFPEEILNEQSATPKRESWLGVA